MEEVSLHKIFRDAETKQIIKWEPHRCPPSEVQRYISTPVTSLLSIGLNAISAGASIYNAFQLAKQERMLNLISQKLNIINRKLDIIDRRLDIIDRKLDIIDRKLDYIMESINQLMTLTTQILMNTQTIKEIEYVKVFFDGARIHFEEKLRSGEITLDALQSLIGDIEATLNEVKKRKTINDAPIPNWMIEKSASVFSFIKILNMFLIEVHNRLVNYEPLLVRRYEPIDDTKIYNYYDDVSDDKVGELYDELVNISKFYDKVKFDTQPRLKWLLAFLWEAKLLLYNYSSSKAIQEWNTPLMIPMMDESIMQQLNKTK